jgi:UDP-N-acetylmuramyl pentapeptide phosphotransferase/UDP-N-acetylglucosamine-1-phosphate transferase
MQEQNDGGSRWHPGISIHKIPVAGVGGLIFAVGIVVLALVGLPIAKWFLVGAVILGVGVVGILRLVRKLKPQTEVEEVQLNVGRQTRQP